MKIRFTPRQKEICELLLCGLTYPQMAVEMGIHPGTVKNMAKELITLSGQDDRVGLALWLHNHREELGITCPCDCGYTEGALLVVA